MWKQIVTSVVFALIVSSGAAGTIIVQDQGTVIGTANGIHLLQSDENGGSSQTLILSMTQDDSGISSLFGSAHLIGLTSSFGGISGISTMTGIANGLLASGLVSPWTANSLGDQARLHMLMLAAR
jgi:hypothetical protein